MILWAHMSVHLYWSKWSGRRMLYWFKLACSATQTWNFGIGKYEHLIILSRQRKQELTRPCAGYYGGKWNPNISMALPALIRLTPPLKPRFVSGIHAPSQGRGYTKDWCIKRVKVVVSTQTKWVNREKNHPFLWSPKVDRSDLKSSSHFSTYYFC